VVIYNIPLELLEGYRGRDVIVRCSNTRETVERSNCIDPGRIIYLQLLSLEHDATILAQWAPGALLDLLIDDPQADYPGLYRYAELKATHPLRVSIPVGNAFGKAARLAASLDLSVKLDVSQPDPAQISELQEILRFYLHQSTVSQPIEYFHSLLMGWVHRNPARLWSIQEEDPSLTRFVTDQGEEIPSRRLAGGGLSADAAKDLEAFKRELVAEKGECVTCDFFEVCEGYFKRPRRDYSCKGVRSLFKTIYEAADELRDLVAAADVAKEKSP
jgi:hypothetical protein